MEEMPQNAGWVAMIRDIGLVLGVPALVAAALWLIRQHITVLQDRNALEQKLNALASPNEQPILSMYVVRCSRTFGPFFLERVLAPVCG